MAKEFDIYLRDPSTAFDIYLKNHLTECDIIVYSIPYRNGITVADRLILESCLESYRLQKLIAMQANSELVSHIDEMIKICIKKLNCGTEIVANIEICPSYAFYPLPVIAELSSGENLDSVKTVFEKIDSKINLAVADIDISDDLKTNIIKAKSELLLDTEVVKTSKQTFNHTDTSLISTANTVDLYCRLYDSFEGACNIIADVSETELRRHRLLSEMDNNPLDVYDSMTLDNVDYITL